MKTVMEMFSLKDRLAVITGGAGLLGTKHAEAILEAGGSVALLDLNRDRLLSTSDRLRAQHGTERVLALATDITSGKSLSDARDAIESYFKKNADILINNAAIDPKFENKPGAKPLSRLEAFPLEQWNLELSVGLTGSFLAVQTFGPKMAATGRGVILNIASDLGLISPDQRIYRQPGVADDMQPVKPVTYSAIKHGLMGLTKYVATYWAKEGVRCNAFAPGGVFNNHPQEFVDKLTPLIPMGRMANVDEYKAAVVFLVSDASSYMNGATLVFDGGRSIM